MITYTFILKDTNSQTSPVFLAIRGNGRRLKISTGLTVQTDAWDKDNFQMTRKSPFHKTENAVLLRWKNAAETAVREAELDNASLEVIKLKDRLKKEKAVLEQALFELKQNNIKRNIDSKDSSAYITVKELRFMIRTSNNDCINPYANTIYRDVHKEKNITTKSSVWPVGWPKKK